MGTYAPSTLASFLRSFTFGHVRPLEALIGIVSIPKTASIIIGARFPERDSNPADSLRSPCSLPSGTTIIFNDPDGERMERWTVKHVSNSTWERLKDKAAVHLYGQLLRDARNVDPAVSAPETTPMTVQRPVDSRPPASIPAERTNGRVPPASS